MDVKANAADSVLLPMGMKGRYEDFSERMYTNYEQLQHLMIGRDTRCPFLFQLDVLYSCLFRSALHSSIISIMGVGY